MRVSEALGLRLADVQPNGLLLIREAKLGKNRLVPLHPSTVDALNNFLDKRRKLPATDDHLFLSPGGRRISRSTVNRGGRVRLNSVSVPIDGFPANFLPRLPLWGIA